MLCSFCLTNQNIKELSFVHHTTKAAFICCFTTIVWLVVNADSGLTCMPDKEKLNHEIKPRFDKRLYFDSSFLYPQQKIQPKKWTMSSICVLCDIPMTCLWSQRCTNQRDSWS